MSIHHRNRSNPNIFSINFPMLGSQDGLNLDGDAEQIETALLKVAKERWNGDAGNEEAKTKESTNGLWVNFW